jgi:hypothetical protein
MPVGYEKIKGLKRPNTSISYTLEQVKDLQNALKIFFILLKNILLL